MAERLKLAALTRDTMNIPEKSDVLFERLNKGILFNSYYDLETTSLSKDFAECTEFGGAITDLGGNLMHVVDYKGKPSDYNLIEPIAWVITRMTQDRLENGLNQYLLAGKVMDFFHVANHLDEAPFKNRFLRTCKKGTFTAPDGTKAKYYKYPLRNEDGSVDDDSLRIHESCKKFYFRDPQSGEWVKRNINSKSVGYNNVNADDQWIWRMLHKAGAENIFQTHVKGLGKYRQDMLRVAEAAVTIGSSGEKGVKAGKKIDSATQKEITSFTQGNVIESNTRFANDVRGVLEGVTNPDGSHVNMDQLHGAVKDVLALIGLTHFIERQVPEVVLEMERNMDWHEVIERLAEKKDGFGNHPITAMVDKEYPNVSGKMVSMIGTDQYRNQPKVALVWDLSYDPKTYSHNGKTLEELDDTDFKALIQKGVMKVIRAHHNPRLFSADVGFRCNFNKGLERPELHDRAKYLQDAALQEKAMAGLRLAKPQLSGPQYIMMPQLEQEAFRFSTLEKLDVESGQSFQVRPIKNPLDFEAQNERDKIMKTMKLMLRAIEPRERFLMNGFKSKDQERAAANAFVDKIDTINKTLKKEGVPPLPPPKRDVTDKQSAYRYKVELMVDIRNRYARGALKDIGHNYWVEDRHGHKIPDDVVKGWGQKEIDDARKSGDVNIVFEDVNVMVELIDRNLDQLGFAPLLGAEVQEHLNDQKALKRHGIPCLNGEGPWPTFQQIERTLVKLVNNELEDEDRRAVDKRYPGMWETFMSNLQNAEGCLNEYMQYLSREKDRFPTLTPQQMARLQINPIDGSPMEGVRYTIDPKHTTTVTVPDRYLEAPTIDPTAHKPLWIVPLTNAFNETSLQNDLQSGKSIILEGAATGKKLHLPKALMLEKPPARGGVYDAFYSTVQKRYEDSNMALPPAKQTLALMGENAEPIHHMNTRSFDYFSLSLEKDLFEGLLDHRLSGFSKPLQGFVLYDDRLNLYEGPVRLQEADDDGARTGWEFVSDIKQARRLTTKQIRRFSDEKAQQYGYVSAEDMGDAVSKLFSAYQLNPDDSKNKVWVVDLGKIDQFDAVIGTKFYNPAVKKISAYEPDFSEELADIQDGKQDRDPDLYFACDG